MRMNQTWPGYAAVPYGVLNFSSFILVLLLCLGITSPSDTHKKATRATSREFDTTNTDKQTYNMWYCSAYACETSFSDI